MLVLFMNKIYVSVPDGTVLTFLPPDHAPELVRFGIGGVWFETSEDVVKCIPDSFFATYLASPMNSSSKQEASPAVKELTLSGPEFASAELFPLVFDFMCRKRDDSRSVLRTVGLNSKQSLALDAIESFLFPCTEPLGTDRAECATGPRYAINPATGRVQLAMLPAYQSMGMGHVAVKGGDFIYHEHSALCKDPRFVKLVLDYKRCKRSLDDAMVARLNEDYSLVQTPITRGVIKHCEIREVERGEEFVIVAEEDSGTYYLDVLTEADGGLEWTVV